MQQLRKSLDKVETRQRLNAHLHEFIERIEVFTHGLSIESNDQEFDDYLDAVEYESGVRIAKSIRPQFVEWVESQRQTKAGRFLRIHLKMSAEQLTKMKEVFGDDYTAFIDAVPKGSIAGRPNIQTLWEQFTTRKKPR
jgi:hypothetical protein